MTKYLCSAPYCSCFAQVFLALKHGGDTLIRPCYTWLTSIRYFTISLSILNFSHTTFSLYLFFFFFLRNQIDILLNITKEHQTKRRIWLFFFLANASATQLQLRLTWQKQKKLNSLTWNWKRTSSITWTYSDRSALPLRRAWITTPMPATLKSSSLLN